MKKSVGSVILFVFLAAVAVAFLGMLSSRFFIPKDAGLAGGAMVLGYGVLGLLIGLVGALVGVRFLSPGQLHRFNLVLGAAVLLVAAWLTYRFLSLPSPPESPTPEIRPTAPAVVDVPAEIPLSEGPGMARPFLEAGRILHFYETAAGGRPIDSLVFREGPHQLELGHAPGWWQPEVEKLDYQLCYLKVKAEENGHLAVEGNRQTGFTCWVAADEVEFLKWSDFLLTVHSVEPRFPEDQLILKAPAADAEPLFQAGEGYILQPKEVRGEWLRVEVVDEDYQPVGEGWLQWRAGTSLWVEYNLLS